MSGVYHCFVENFHIKFGGVEFAAEVLHSIDAVSVSCEGVPAGKFVWFIGVHGDKTVIKLCGSIGSTEEFIVGVFDIIPEVETVPFDKLWFDFVIRDIDFEHFFECIPVLFVRKEISAIFSAVEAPVSSSICVTAEGCVNFSC